MELRQLRYLLAIAEEGNFTRAAGNVFVSQSALSQQIQSLEQEVGTTLLDRSKRGVQLTAAGEILCYHAQRVLMELDAAEIALQELEGLQRGDLRIGVVQTVNAYLMPTLVAAFRQQYPKIKLMVEELSADEIETRLAAGTLQIGIGFIPTSEAHIEAQSLFDERLVLIVRKDHPLATKSAVPVKALDQLPMVMLSNTFCTRRMWEESAKLAAAQPEVIMEMNTVSTILNVVEKSSIATVLPEMTLDEGSHTGLVRIKLQDPTPSRQVGLLWNRDNYLCQASRAFMDTVVAHIDAS